MAKAKAGTLCVYVARDRKVPAYVALRLPGGVGNVALAALGDSAEEATALLAELDRRPLNKLEAAYCTELTCPKKARLAIDAD